MSGSDELADETPLRSLPAVLDDAQRWLASPEGEARLSALEREEREAHQRDEVRTRLARLDELAGRLDPDGERAMREALTRQRPPGRTDAMRAVWRWWRARTEPALLLLGGTGRGKTFAAMHLVCMHGGQYVHGAQLARRWESWRSDRIEDRDPIRASGRLIVVDDLGTEASAARTHAALVELLDQRQTIDRRTVLSLNLSRPELRSYLGDERLLSRLRAISQLHECAGDDLRAKRVDL